MEGGSGSDDRMMQGYAGRRGTLRPGGDPAEWVGLRSVPGHCRGDVIAPVRSPVGSCGLSGLFPAG